MEIKWVCPVCSSTNICEKSDHMQCFVCGKVENGESREISGEKIKGARKSLLSVFSRIKTAKASKAAVVPPVESSGSESVPAETPKKPPKRERIGWTIKRSPAKKKEAYLEAEPIYKEIPEEPVGLIPESTPVTPPVSSEPVISTGGGDGPWPEHHIDFVHEKITAMGYTKVTRTEMGGVKCYKLVHRNGSEKILNDFNMKMLGMAKNK